MSLRPNAHAEVRKKAYKVAVDADEARCKREDNLVEIRKSKCKESLLKKRKEGMPLQLGPGGSQSSSVEKKLESLPTLVYGVLSNDPSAHMEATHQFLKLLSIEHNPPIEEVIASGVVPRLVEFLLKTDFRQLQFKAAWALTNIAFGTSDHTRVVIDHGAVPIFVQLLSSPGDDVREHVYCLS